MNYKAFTNDSLTMMYEGVRGALATDDALKGQDLETRFRVRETPDWKKHAADLEAEMLKRGPAPLTSRRLRSSPDLNRQHPLARPTPSDPLRRSMSASTIRPVRHSIPSPLSIVARPHEADLIRSWRADSLAFVWARFRNYPMLKNSPVEAQGVR